MYGFQQCSRTAAGIDRAIHPGVAMAASHDPIVWQLTSSDSANHIPDGPVLVILLEVNLDANRPRTEVVCERPSALPFLRRSRTFQRLQDGTRVLVRKRRHWNGGELLGLAWRYTLAVWQRGCRGNSRRSGVAR